MLDWQTFVQQRRINRPSQEVLHAISNPAVFGSGAVLSSDADGALRLEEPFRRVARFASPVWRGNARLDRKHRRRGCRVENEVSPLAVGGTGLLNPSRSRHPRRWYCSQL